MSSDQRAEFPASGEFPASYDAVTKIISAVTCVLALVAAVAIHNPIATTILILVFALSYAYSPRGYSVSAKTIIVKRLIGNVRISLEDARVAKKIDADDLRGCMRLWGSGGLFGYYGLFRTTKLGRCTWYATNRKKLFVAIGATKTTVFSPDDVDGFLRAIRAEVPAATSESGEPAIGMESGAASNPASTWIGLILAIFAALVALAGILLILHTRRGIH
jgi:hypothetical protein